jgi:3-phenylpropionate/trans-cinnamate dioxygenase ferredoxin reductase component
MSVMEDATVAVVGAGLAGFQIATALREQHYKGRVVLVGDEAHGPYHRPPLSKGYLLGSADDTSVAMRPAAYYADKQIELLTGTRAVAIDRTHHKLALENGAVIDYGHLVLAVGARNRPLHVPGSDLAGVFYLRHLDEARALRAALGSVKRALVVGAGFIGLEFAACAVKLGVEVTVLEVADRPMSRALSAPMSNLFVREHSRNGMRFAFNTQVKRLVGVAGKVVAVETVAGQVLPGEIVVIGIGVIPNVELAATCNLEVRNGIIVDGNLSTADPHISAIGDCAVYPNPYSRDEIVRLESVQNATDQGRCLAARILGKPVPYSAVPWFWSDQGALRLQIAGLTAGYDETVIRGDPAGTNCAVFCFRDGQLLGVETVNRPADHMVARRLLSNRVPVSPSQAADETVDLKLLAASTRPAALP